MIDIVSQLAAGFVHCLTPLNMAMLLIGIVIGLLIGVLPGLTLTKTGAAGVSLYIKKKKISIGEIEI
jgi:TctA family transporter